MFMHTFTCTRTETVCARMCVIMYMWCECAGSGGGCVSWGPLWNVSARPSLTAMRWANMKSKWKRPTKGWKEDD